MTDLNNLSEIHDKTLKTLRDAYFQFIIDIGVFEGTAQQYISAILSPTSVYVYMVIKDLHRTILDHHPEFEITELLNAFYGALKDAMTKHGSKDVTQH